MARNIFKYSSLVFISCMILASCMSPEEWLSRNPTTTPTDPSKPEPEKPFVDVYNVSESYTGNDVVKIRVKSGTTFSNVSMPDVKYNLKTPVVLVADDMTDNDLTVGWCLFNGYPTGYKYSGETNLSSLDKRYCNDFLRVLQGTAANGSYTHVLSAHEPYTYDTGDGKNRRWAMSSAIFPAYYNARNYTRFNGDDALGMMRMGHSFLQHNVTENFSGQVSLEMLSTAMQKENAQWRKHTGVGLKILAEPDGDKTYIECARINKDICFSVFQQAGSIGYLVKYGADTYFYKGNTPDNYDEKIQFEPITHDISAWADGSVVTDFMHKGHSAMERTFMTGGDEDKLYNQVKENAGTGILNVFGMHGINGNMLIQLQRLHNDCTDLWVASMDEVWEYYYLKKNVTISCQSVGNGETEITFVVPRYTDHQFRDFTVNIPVSDVEDITFGDGIVTSGWKNNSNGYCVVNIGLETRVYKYITEYLNIAYKNKYNTCIKRDLEYLINQLKDGAKKDEYTKLYSQIYK